MFSLVCIGQLIYNTAIRKTAQNAGSVCMCEHVHKKTCVLKLLCEMLYLLNGCLAPAFLRDKSRAWVAC